MKVMLILEALDKASRPIKAVEKAFGGMGKVAKASAKEATSAMKALDSKLAALQSRMKNMAMGGVGAAIGAGFAAMGEISPVVKAVKSFHEFEDALNDIGMKGNLAGDELNALGDTLRKLAPKTNQSALELAKGMDVLTGFGMNTKDAMKVTEPIARAATATKAATEDLSRSVYAGIDNLKVPVGDVTKMLDIMAMGGKEGAFELKDMAQYFSKLTAGANQLGFKGTDGIASLTAALQIARKGSGNAEEAANNMQNFFAKLGAKDSRKNFKEMGIDIVKVTEQAKKSVDPMKVYMEAIAKVTKLDKDGNFDLTKLTDLFGDMQVQNFLKPMLQNMKEYQAMQEKIKGAKGVVDKDFEKRMALGVQKVQAMTVAMSGLALTFGEIFAPLANKAIDKITSIITAFNAWATLNPELAGGLTTVVIGITALVAALAIGKILFGVVGGALMSFARVLMFLGSPIMFVIRMIWMLTAAMLANPIGLIIAAIAIAALLIYKYWGPIKGFFQRLWTGVLPSAKATFAGIGQTASAYWTMITSIWGRFGTFFKTIFTGGDIKGAFSTLFNGIWDDVKGFFEKFTSIWGDVGTKIQDSFKDIKLFGDFQWKDMLPDWDWKSIIPEMPDWKSWFGGKANANRAMIGQVGLPEMPEGLVGLEGDPKKAIAFQKKIAAQDAARKKAEAAKVKKNPVSELPKAATPNVEVQGMDEVQSKVTAVTNAVNAIPPAATQASNGATATLAALDGTTHGVRFMETFAKGILSAVGSVTGAVNSVVGAARAYLPHSPAKVGPLSDLDKVKFSETLAMNIKPAPAVNAVKAVAAGMLAAIPTSMPAPAFAMPAYSIAQPPQAALQGQASGDKGQNGGASGSSNVTVNFTVNVTGSKDGADLASQLKGMSYEIAQIVQRELAKQGRLAH
jgi:TP901 family phage tail tape measure protein